MALALRAKQFACVQDPRISYNPADKTYYMTYCVYGPPLPKVEHGCESFVPLACTAVSITKSLDIRLNLHCWVNAMFAKLPNRCGKDPKSNPDGIKCGGAGVGLATSKTPTLKDSWVRHGYNCNNGTQDNCGKSAAILIRDSGPHYMFWGIPTIAVSVSDDLIHWTLINSSWVVPNGGAQEMWVEAGSPPMKLSDGNYIMSYNIADGDLW
eukprot:SAG11_NODE_872_length_6802_cov_8.951514_3_plen_210_part_00